MPLTKQTITLNDANKFPDNLKTDILYIDSESLPEGEIMPGQILFNAPKNYIPMRVFIECNSDLTDFVIQDSEQTIIFATTNVFAGTSCLFPKNGVCPPFLPTLNLSCRGNQQAGLRVIVEYHKSPFN